MRWVLIEEFFKTNNKEIFSRNAKVNTIYLIYGLSFLI